VLLRDTTTNKKQKFKLVGNPTDDDGD